MYAEVSELIHTFPLKRIWAPAECVWRDMISQIFGGETLTQFQTKIVIFHTQFCTWPKNQCPYIASQFQTSKMSLRAPKHDFS